VPPDPEPPAVSVVIATNRSGPYLAEAIASVLAQTAPAHELIVVDDGSPQPALVDEAVAGVPGARVIHQGPRGVSVARNVGAAGAHGNYLAFLDDDDRWHPTRLEAQLAAFEAAPDAVAGYCGLQTIDATGERVLAPADQTAVGSHLDVARRVTGILAPNLLIRRSAFDAVGGFHSQIRFAEDLDLVLRLAELGPFAFAPGALVDYRLTGSNTTARHRELAQGIDRVLRLHLAAADERHDGELAAALRASLAANERYVWWASLRAARAAAAQRRPARAVGEVLWAARSAPLGPVRGVVHRLEAGLGARRGPRRG
jgi:glycosyltransferase involved in cell wall biosynthesis